MGSPLASLAALGLGGMGGGPNAGPVNPAGKLCSYYLVFVGKHHKKLPMRKRSYH